MKEKYGMEKEMRRIPKEWRSPENLREEVLDLFSRGEAPFLSRLEDG